METSQNPSQPNVTSINNPAETIEQNAMPQNLPTVEPVTKPEANISSVEKLLANMSDQQNTAHSQNKSKVMALVLIVLGIIFIVAAVAFYIFKMNGSDNTTSLKSLNTETSTNVTPTPTAIPSPTPMPTDSDSVVSELDAGMKTNASSESQTNGVDSSIDKIKTDFEGFGQGL